MRFETLPPTVLEKLGLDDDVEAFQKVILEEVAQTSRIASKTSLTTATSVAYDVVLPPSPVFTLLLAYVAFTVLRYTVSRLKARSSIRRHEKIL